MRLLQVDDDPIFNAVCEKHFSGRNDLEFTQFNNVTQAERRLMDSPPVDVLMLDLSLPDRDGIEFLSTIKQLNFKGRLILVSSQPRSVIDMAATLASSLGLNLVLRLEKPLTPEKLARIDEAIAAAG
ncbi:MAG: response regulator [Anderseniella sp.]|jgi:DNA-binding NtrC family response regulator|nr:response regulator [Anderseniella sp.]